LLLPVVTVGYTLRLLFTVGTVGLPHVGWLPVGWLLGYGWFPQFAWLGLRFPRCRLLRTLVVVARLRYGWLVVTPTFVPGYAVTFAVTVTVAVGSHLVVGLHGLRWFGCWLRLTTRWCIRVAVAFVPRVGALRTLV